MQKIKITIPDSDYRNIKKITSRFHNNNFQCYLVGGSVRDLILGNSIHDYDFATDARPEDVMKLFRRVIPTGIKHGTVSILMNDKSFAGKTIEVTTYRSDGKYIDGRRPESVSFSSSLEEDIKRRDFTINGLAYSPEEDEVIDYTGGLRDLENRVIRTIGDPVERFMEDGLRPLRACRFASRLKFSIDENTFTAIGRTLDIFKKVSAERVRDEFMKILVSGKPSEGIECLRKSGLLDIFLPELANCYGFEQNKFHMYDVYYHSIYSCDGAPADMPLIRLSALLHDIGKVPTRSTGEDGDYTFYNHEVVGARMTRRIMKRLKFSNEDIERTNVLIVNHMFHYIDEWTDGAVRRFMRKVGLENIDDLLLLRLADRRGNGSRDGLPVPIRKLQARIAKIIEEENAITVRDLDINGNIIMDEFRLKPGPVIGRVLNELLEVVLDEPEANTRDNLLSLAREIVKNLDTEKLT